MDNKTRTAMHLAICQACQNINQVLVDVAGGLVLSGIIETARQNQVGLTEVNAAACLVEALATDLEKLMQYAQAQLAVCEKIGGAPAEQILAREIQAAIQKMNAR
jgi:outer membrane murein-binding lipoprotein Lpp